MLPTPEQDEAASVAGSAVVIASAGTGKTTVLTLRFARCLEWGVSPASVLAFTFTEKAAREMRDRIRERLALDPDSAAALNVSTIHAFLAGLLRRHGFRLGLDPGFAVLDERAARASSRRWLDLRLARALREGEGAVASILRLYGESHLADAVRGVFDRHPHVPLVTEGLVAATSRDIVAFMEGCRAWRDELLRERVAAGALAFDDLETLSLRLLDAEPELAVRLRREFRHILLDEFQDTSPVQLELITLLYRPGENELFAVGDPKQAIYGFRHASARSLDGLLGLVRASGGRVFELTRTFRTPPRIMEYCNGVFPRVFADAYVPLSTANESPASDVYAHESTGDSGGVATIVLDIVRRILARGAAPDTVAVISASRKHFDNVADSLARAGIPTALARNLSPFDAPAFHLLFHALLVAGGRRDAVTLLGLAATPLIGVPENEAAGLIRAHPEEPWTVAPAATKAPEAWSRFASLTARWIGFASVLSATELARAIFRDAVAHPSARDFDDFALLSGALESWFRQGFRDAPAVVPLLEEWASGIAVADGPPDGRGVRILTVHAAKGLEFEHVVVIPAGRPRADARVWLADDAGRLAWRIPDPKKDAGLGVTLADGEDFSAIKEAMKEQDRAERRRLVYVALTRARANLFLVPAPPGNKDLSTALRDDPSDTKACREFDDWLAWLSRQPGVKQITEFPEDAFLKDRESLSTSSAAPATPSDPLAQEAAVPVLSPPLFSVTDLETYAECPKKFELARVRGVMAPRVPGPAASPEGVPPLFTRLTSAERGTLVHEILEFYDPARSNLDEVVAQALANQQIPDDGSVTAEALRLTRAMQADPGLRAVLFENEGVRREMEFTLGLAGVTLTGQIDNLVLKGGRWTIVDYKTHRTDDPRRIAAIAEACRFQLLCYALAVSRATGQIGVPALLIFTHAVTPRWFTFTGSELKDFEGRLNRLATKLTADTRAAGFALTEDRLNCRDCPYFHDNLCGVAARVDPSRFLI